MQHLAKRNILCPLPIADKNGKILTEIKGKPCTIISFLKGAEAKEINNSHIEELGKNVARMHMASYDFPLIRKNDFC